MELAEAVAEARRAVGQPPVRVAVAPYPVDRAMIAHWCRALGDHNPVYLDDAVARTTPYGGIIAPPAMLGSWTMDASAGASGSTRDTVLGALQAAGLTAVVATDYEQEYQRPLRPGDVVAEDIAVEDVSDPKQTRLGEGCFVTVRHDYRLADTGEPVGVARMRLLVYRPATASADGRAAGRAGGGADSGGGRPDAAPAGSRPRPLITRDNAFFWEGVATGELRIQRCRGCGTLRHPPRPMCGHCRSLEWDTVVSSGRGQVFSYAIHHHPPLPGFALPHPIVVVELEEGVRLVSSTVGIAPEELRIGLPVRVVFEQVEEDLVLPLFTHAEAR